MQVVIETTAIFISRRRGQWWARLLLQPGMSAHSCATRGYGSQRISTMKHSPEVRRADGFLNLAEHGLMCSLMPDDLMIANIHGVTR